MSGYLDTVIAGCHGDDIAHLGCHDSCCCDTKQLGDGFTCPYLHNCCIGKIVAINRYTVAMETFVIHGNQQHGQTTSSDGLKCHTVLYVEFSLSDAIILGDMVKKNKNIFQESNKQRCRAAGNTAFQKTVTMKFKDKYPGLERLKVEDKEKIDIENMKPSDKVNIEKDGVLSKVANGCETKEETNTVVSNGTDTETVTSKSMLHRHVSAAGGSYFCRKTNCSQGKDRDKCVPVLSVKPIVKKRKSLDCHDKTNSKILCVSTVRSPDGVEHERSHMDAGDSRNLDNARSDTRKIVTETKSKSDQFTECYTKLRTWSDSCCIVKVNSRESAVIDTWTKDSMSMMFNVQAQIWKDGNFQPEVSFSFSFSLDGLVVQSIVSLLRSLTF